MSNSFSNRRRFVRLAFFLFLSALLFGQTTPQQWDADLGLLVKKIKETHPAPFRRVPERQFDDTVARLHADLPRLSPEESLVRVMEVAALLRDRHTSALPSKDSEFRSWFPVRIYQFTDGPFITAIGRQYKGFIV